MSQTTQGQFAGPAESPEEALRRRELEKEYERKGETADFGKAAEGFKQDIGIGNNDPEDIASTVARVKQAETQEKAPEDIDFEAAYGDTEHNDVLLAKIDPQEIGTETQNPTLESTEKIPENKVEEQVYAPLINRIEKSGVLSPEQAQEIKEGLASGGDFQEIIGATEGLDPKVQQHIIDRWGELNSEEGAEKFSKQFKKDFSAELTDSLDEKQEFTLDSLNYIAPSYLSAGESTNPEEKKEALNMAIEMGVNNFLDGKQFERTEAFEIDLQNVKNPDLTFQERIEAFENIMKQVGTDQGAKAGKTKETNKKIRDKERNQHEQAIKTAEVALNDAKKSGNAEQLRTAEIALKEAQKSEKDSIKTGDAKVLGGGKLDAMSEATQESLKKAA